MISHELYSVEANSRASASLADQVARFLADGGRIEEAPPLEPKPRPARRETEPAPHASKLTTTEPKPIKTNPDTLAARQRARRAELAPAVRELAKTTNARQIAIRLGIGMTTLRTIGREYDIIFIPARSSALVAAELASAERLNDSET